MILVDDAGGEWPKLGHAPWNGCNLADFVMPFFLFIVGMAIPLAFKVAYHFLSIHFDKEKVLEDTYICHYKFMLAYICSLINVENYKPAPCRQEGDC